MLRHIVSFLHVQHFSFPALCLVNTTLREIASPLLYKDPEPWTSSELSRLFEPVGLSLSCLFLRQTIADSSSFRQPATRRLSSLKTSLALDCVRTLHPNCHSEEQEHSDDQEGSDDQDHSHVIERFPTHPFPKLNHMYLYFTDRACLFRLLSAGHHLLATLDPLSVYFSSHKVVNFVNIPRPLWTSISPGWFRLETIGYRLCILGSKMRRVRRGWYPGMWRWRAQTSAPSFGCIGKRSGRGLFRSRELR
jgi:hypothetical protein